LSTMVDSQARRTVTAAEVRGHPGSF